MSYQLDPHQHRVIEELFAWFYANPTGNPIVNACVASGKSVMIAEICRIVMTQWPDQRILMVVASKELVVQNYEKLRSIYPEGDCGLYSASAGRKNPHAKIVFATIGSIYDKAMHTGAFNICIIDECHNVSRKEVGMYRQMIADYTRLNAAFRVVGFTGTPFRGNGVLLTEGEEAIFTAIAANVSIREMLDAGFLAPLVLSETKTKTDVSGVHINNATGDYNVSELAKAIDQDSITKSAVAEIVEAGSDRKLWLIFGVDVEHCEHIHQELQRYGIQGAVVHGGTPAAQRDKILAHFKAGRLRYVVNCMVLTVGFDAPATDLIALIRNTHSPVLYVQIAGRGMRKPRPPAPPKRNCLWLDFTDTTSTLGPVDQIKGRIEIKRQQRTSNSVGESIVICPQCQSRYPVTTQVCACGYKFVVRTVSANAVSSDAPILSGGETTSFVMVDSWRCSRHFKTGSPAPDTMRVIYYPKKEGNLSLENHSEWLCFDHQGYARSKAESWWVQMGGLVPLPAGVDEALDRFNELSKPDYIEVIKEGKFTKVLNHGKLPKIPNASTKTTADSNNSGIP